ncbi:MAG TPA: MOSC domain-containing protein [Candidatus Limnocylindria bacterium]|jgi:MOSC domain-containing protein YiiM
MRTFEELESLWATVPSPPRERGTLRLVCRRVEPGVHETPDEAELSVEAGLVGDRWDATRDPDHEAQVTLMNATVAELVAADRQPLHEAGDNLIVDFDIGHDNLPPGSRVRIGETVLEVTDSPHTGCSKFSERFGQDALRWVNWRHWRERRLRGVNARVIEGGTIRVGDEVTRVTAGVPA